jgi:transposase
MTVEKKRRRKYTEEFKREAVSLITEQGYRTTDAARSLGINENVLRKWKRGFEDEASGAGLSSGERVELQRLRRENRELRMEAEILKKASAYFAKQMK